MRTGVVAAELSEPVRGALWVQIKGKLESREQSTSSAALLSQTKSFLFDRITAL